MSLLYVTVEQVKSIWLKLKDFRLINVGLREKVPFITFPCTCNDVLYHEVHVFASNRGLGNVYVKALYSHTWSQGEVAGCFYMNHLRSWKKLERKKGNQSSINTSWSLLSPMSSVDDTGDTMRVLLLLLAVHASALPLPDPNDDRFLAEVRILLILLYHNKWLFLTVF